MQLGFWQIVIIALIVVLLFGRGKISELMGDVAKGINSFKKGLKEDETEAEAADTTTIEHKTAETVSTEDAKETRNAS